MFVINSQFTILIAENVGVKETFDSMTDEKDETKSRTITVENDQINFHVNQFWYREPVWYRFGTISNECVSFKFQRLAELCRRNESHEVEMEDFTIRSERQMKKGTVIATGQCN